MERSQPRARSCGLASGPAGAEHRRRHRAVPLDALRGLRGGEIPDEGADGGVDLGARAAPADDRRPGVGLRGELGAAHRLSEPRPLRVVLGGDADPLAARRRVVVVGHQIPIAVRHPRRRAPARDPLADDRRQLPRKILDLREVDPRPLPAAVAQGERRHGGEHHGQRHGGIGVHRRRRLLKRRAGMAAHQVVADHGVEAAPEHPVPAVRPVLAPRGERDEGGPRLDRVQGLPAEAQPLQGPRGEALDEEIRAGDQPAQHLGAVLRAHVDGDVPLVAVRVVVDVDALVRGARARPDAGVLHDGTRHRAPGEGLELHDVGPEVGEQRAPHRPRPDLGQLDHAHAPERRAAHGATPARASAICSSGA